MKPEYEIELIREAAARFSNAGVPWSRARAGIFGFWIGDDCYEKADGSLGLAQESEKRWSLKYCGMENPYTCIVHFMSHGGVLFRWNHGILDMRCGDGSKFGVPESSFKQA